jgi:DNA-binding NarL/FixJ family response regulator
MENIDVVNSQPYSALIIDDHPAFAEGISYIISTCYSHTKIRRAESAKSARCMLGNTQELDAIFLDYQLPDQNGLQLLHDIKALKVRAPVIMISENADITLTERALCQGAMAYLTKSSTPQQYHECLDSIRNGRQYLPSDIRRELRHYRNTIHQCEDKIQHQLSKRQLEILLLISKGYSNIEIGKALNISKNTVKSHVSVLMEVLNTRNRIECVDEARRLKIEC